MNYNVSDEFLRHLGRRGPGPGGLDRAHRAVIGLPTPLYEQLTTEAALTHMERVGIALGSIVNLMGSENWPVPPVEVARRAIKKFPVKLPWTMWLYQNQSCEKPRSKTRYATGTMVFEGGKWAIHVDPTQGDLPHNEGCAVQEFEGPWFHEVFQRVQAHLEAVTVITFEACNERQARDQESRDRGATG